MKIKYFPIIYLPAALLLVVNSCFDNPVETDNELPGRRDYTWTADTLWTEEWFGYTDIWGSSPNSIWMVALGASAQDCLWYYDGMKWARYNQILSPSLTTVFGINEQEIWLADAYGSIWQNKGSGWDLFKQVTISGYSWIVINSIYGKSSNNLYAVGTADNYDGSGYKGIILRYDGVDWRLLNIREIRAGFYEITKMNNGKYIIRGENSDNGFLEKLYIFDGSSTLTEIYSDYDYPTIYEMNGDVYVVINSRIYKCINNKLKLWKDFSNTPYVRTVLGRNEKDFFGCGYEGIMHYNGTDFKIIYSTSLEQKGLLIFEKDVFFWTYTGGASGYNYIMIRGTLDE